MKDVPVNDDDGQEEDLDTMTNKESNKEDIRAMQTTSDKDTVSNLHHALHVVSNDDNSTMLILLRSNISGRRSAFTAPKQEQKTCP